MVEHNGSQVGVAPGKIFHENQPISYGKMQPPDGWKPPPVTRTPPTKKGGPGKLTNGVYTLDEPGMAPHTTDSLAGGKSQFLYHINEKELVLDAAAYADKANLWVGNKAKVVFDRPIGVHGETGQPTNVLNIYKTDSGFIHAAPGSPGG